MFPPIFHGVQKFKIFQNPQKKVQKFNNFPIKFVQKLLQNKSKNLANFATELKIFSYARVNAWVFFKPRCCILFLKKELALAQGDKLPGNIISSRREIMRVWQERLGRPILFYNICRCYFSRIQLSQWRFLPGSKKWAIFFVKNWLQRNRVVTLCFFFFNDL